MKTVLSTWFMLCLKQKPKILGFLFWSFILLQPTYADVSYISIDSDKTKPILERKPQEGQSASPYSGISLECQYKYFMNDRLPNLPVMKLTWKKYQPLDHFAWGIGISSSFREYKLPSQGIAILSTATDSAQFDQLSLISLSGGCRFMPFPRGFIDASIQYDFFSNAAENTGIYGYEFSFDFGYRFFPTKHLEVQPKIGIQFVNLGSAKLHGQPITLSQGLSGLGYQLGCELEWKI